MTVDLSFWNSVEPEDLFRVVADEENRKFVVRTLKALTPDPVYTKLIVEQVESKRIEMRCFISWLAHELQPKTYLEVGVRRGFSMAMVASQCPEAEIYGFDLWARNYVGVSNPGPKFVQAEMEKIGYRKKVHFINGNSHRTLPAFFQSRRARFGDRVKLSWKFKKRPPTFDLILIDGEHSLLGASQDLADTMPYCAVAGAVVFDDIAPDLSTLSKVELKAVKKELGEDPFGWRDLLGVWRAVQQQFRNFRYFEYVQNPPGVGLAVRLE